MKTRYDIIIGIDPDSELSGVGMVTTSDRYVTGMKKDFPALVRYLCEISTRAKKENQLLVVVVECSWQKMDGDGGYRRSVHNWHCNPGEPKGVIAQKGYSVGCNHETGRKIVEMCRSFGIDVVEHPPLVKCWKGKDRKITAEELESITGFKDRSNQEVRDAILLGWSYAGFPMLMRR